MKPIEKKIFGWLSNGQNATAIIQKKKRGAQSYSEGAGSRANQGEGRSKLMGGAIRIV